MAQEQDLGLVIEEPAGARRKWAVIGVLAIIVAAAGAFAYLYYAKDEDGNELEQTIEQVAAERGTLTNTLFTSGSAAASRQSQLTFSSGGQVQAVEVGLGDAVEAGQVLARLADSDAKLDVEAAEANLEQSRLRLAQTSEPPAESTLAAARQSVSSAMLQLATANLDLEKLQTPPTAAQIAAAEATVEQARASLERLTEAVTEAQIAAADAVIEQARASLERLMEAPSKADLDSADASVEQSRAAFERLQTTPSAADIASADASVAQAKSSLTVASRQVGTAVTSLSSALNSYCDGFSALAALCDANAIPLSDANILALNEILEARVDDGPTFIVGIVQLVQADAAYKNALDGVVGDEASLESAVKRRADLDQGPTAQETLEARTSLEAAISRRAALDESPPQHEVNQANAVLESALKAREALENPPAQYEIDQANAVLKSALEARAALDEPATASEIDRADAAIESAEAALESAQTSLSDLTAGPSETEIRIQEQNVRLAEIALLQAEGRRNDLALTAPYDGVMASVRIVPGDQVTASTPALVIMDPTSIGVDITVSESDLVGLEPGQLAVAEFDSIQGQSYLLQIVGIDTNPTVTQGVVTYTVRAEMVNPRQLSGREDEVQELTALVRDGGELVGGVFALRRPGTEGGGQGGGPGPGGGGRAAIQECVQRVLGRTPAGRGDFTPDERTRIQEECTGGAEPGRGAGAPSARPQDGPSELPTPGMNSSVTVLIDIKPDVLLVPSAAVRRQGRTAFVYVPAAGGEAEQRDVTLGGADGERTEILSGLEEGDVLLMGAGLLVQQAGESQLRPAREVR